MPLWYKTKWPCILSANRSVLMLCLASQSVFLVPLSCLSFRDGNWKSGFAVKPNTSSLPSSLESGFLCLFYTNTFVQLLVLGLEAPPEKSERNPHSLFLVCVSAVSPPLRPTLVFWAAPWPQSKLGLTGPALALLYPLLPRAVVLNQGHFAPQGILGKVWRQFWLSCWGYYWPLVGRGRGGCWTSCSVQDRPSNEERPCSKCHQCWGWETLA